LRQFQSESQDYEREINELSHRYKLLNELKDKITQGKDSIMLILRLNVKKCQNSHSTCSCHFLLEILRDFTIGVNAWIFQGYNPILYRLYVNDFKNLNINLSLIYI